jgi:acylphosphatase
MPRSRAHVLIRGRVQGVSFRYYTMEKARALGLEGWVRNLFDGRVEAVFEGEDAIVGQMVKWCETGPPSALVESVELETGMPTGEYQGFVIRLDSSWGGE